jgi:hypothetical protein
MSGVGTQGDPCTAAICYPISFIPPVVSDLWQSTVCYIKQSHHIRLVPQKFLRKGRNLNSAKTSAIFSCSFPVVHISHTTSGESNIHHPQRPIGQKAYIRWGAAGALKGAFATLLSQPQCHAAFGTMLTPWLQWAGTLFAVLGRYFPPRRGSLGFNFCRETAT